MITPEEENTVPDSPMNRGILSYSKSYLWLVHSAFLCKCLRLHDCSRLINFGHLFLDDDPGSVIPKHYRRVEIKYSKLGKLSLTAF